MPRETKNTSVTLTFATISFVLYATACIFNALDVIKGVSELNQLFFACLAAYVGRKMSLKTKNFSVNHKDGKEDEDS
jgi:hypothetical protein